MLWKTSVQFASEDVRTLIYSALPDLKKTLGEPVYVTDEEKPSLVTQSEIRRRVERVLAEASFTLDTAELAAQLHASRSSIDAVLAEAVSATHSFFDGVHVHPRRRIEAVSDKVLAQGLIRTLSDICSDEKITLKAAAYAIKQKAPHLLIVGREEYVVPRLLLDQHVSAFKKALESASEPTKYSSIERNSVLLPLVKHQLGIASYETEFVPESFVLARQRQAESLLSSIGYVATSEIASIEDPQKLAKRTQSYQIEKYVVSRRYAETEHKRLLASLSASGFADLRDCELYPQLSKFIIEELDSTLQKFRFSKYPPAFLVKPSLERDLVTKANIVLAKEAQTQAMLLDLVVDGSSALSDFVAKLHLPEPAQLQPFVDEMKIPGDLKVGDRVLAQVRKAYSEAASTALRPRFDAALEKLEAKVRCHLNAILGLPSSDLRTLAWEEWQQYVNGLQYSVPANADAAQQQFRVDAAVLRSVVKELQNNALQKLNKLKSRPKDAPLLLHLAGIIYHSQHLATEPAFFKIRGKAVPKLIKQLDFPPCFEALRKQIKEGPEDVMTEVRECVLAEKQV